MTDKKLAITMGDPAGVGPEVCLMLLQEVKSLPSVNLIIYGDHTILERVASATGLPLPSRSMVRHIPSLPDAGAVAPGEVSSEAEVLNLSDKFRHEAFLHDSESAVVTGDLETVDGQRGAEHQSTRILRNVDETANTRQPCAELRHVDVTSLVHLSSPES